MNTVTLHNAFRLNNWDTNVGFIDLPFNIQMPKN